MHITEVKFSLKTILGIIFATFSKSDIEKLPQKFQQGVIQIKAKLASNEGDEVIIEQMKFIYNSIYVLLPKEIQARKANDQLQAASSNQSQSRVTDARKQEKIDVKREEKKAIKKFVEDIADKEKLKDRKLARQLLTKLYYSAQWITTYFTQPSKNIDFIPAYRIIAGIYKDDFWHLQQNTLFTTPGYEDVLERCAQYVGETKSQELYDWLKKNFATDKKTDLLVCMMREFLEYINTTMNVADAQKTEKTHAAAIGISILAAVAKPPAASFIGDSRSVDLAISGTQAADLTSSPTSPVRQSDLPAYPVSAAQIPVSAEPLKTRIAMLIECCSDADQKPRNDHWSSEKASLNMVMQRQAVGIVLYLKGECELINRVKANTQKEYDAYLCAQINRIAEDDYAIFLRLPHKVLSKALGDVSTKQKDNEDASDGVDFEQDANPLSRRKSSLVSSPQAKQVTCALLGDLVGYNMKQKGHSCLRDTKTALQELYDADVIGRTEQNDGVITAMLNLAMVNAYTRYLLLETIQLMPTLNYTAAKQFIIFSYTSNDQELEKAILLELIQSIAAASQEQLTSIENRIKCSLPPETEITTHEIVMLQLLVFYLAKSSDQQHVNSPVFNASLKTHFPVLEKLGKKSDVLYQAARSLSGPAASFELSLPRQRKYACSPLEPPLQVTKPLKISGHDDAVEDVKAAVEAFVEEKRSSKGSASSSSPLASSSPKPP